MGINAPELVAPENGRTIVCLAADTDDATGYTFTWRAVPNATTYIGEIFNSLGTNIGGWTIPGNSPHTMWVHPESALGCGATYQWRVGATFAYAPPAWSGRWSFTIAPP